MLLMLMLMLMLLSTYVICSKKHWQRRDNMQSRAYNLLVLVTRAAQHTISVPWWIIAWQWVYTDCTYYNVLSDGIDRNRMREQGLQHNTLLPNQWNFETNLYTYYRNSSISAWHPLRDSHLRHPGMYHSWNSTTRPLLSDRSSVSRASSMFNLQ